jgi:CheY-like chemotaxis protein
MRILVVDDSSPHRRMLTAIFGRAGHEVLTAGDGESALRLALEARPEVVLLDIGLPGLDGYQVAARLRAGPAAADGWRPLVAAMTGYGDPADRRRALKAGFDLHLVKPVNLDALEHLLATAERAEAFAGS